MKASLPILILLIGLFSCSTADLEEESKPKQEIIDDSLVEAIRLSNERQWFHKNDIDTVIIYNQFHGGQINAMHDYRIWWIKDGKLNKFNVLPSLAFNGFELLFKRKDDITKEKPSKIYTISHMPYENLDLFIDGQEIRIGGEGLDISKCPVRMEIMKYFNQINEETNSAIKD